MRSNSSELKLIEEQLNTIFGLGGTFLMMYDQFDGIIVTQRAPDVVNAIIALARTDKRVREMLLSLSVGTVYAGLVTAILGMIVPILAHHGILPEAVIPFTATPEALSAHIASKARMAPDDANSSN